MERALPGRAVTRRVAAAGLQFVDGAFEQLARRKEVAQMAAILLLQLGEKRALATGLLEIGQDSSLFASLLYVIYHNNIKKSSVFSITRSKAKKDSVGRGTEPPGEVGNGERADASERPPMATLEGSVPVG